VSGHSKWSSIKRQKAVNDQSRGRVFAKLAREIAVAARHGGADPGFNPRLRTAIENAKSENMPGDNIERAIRRGTGELPGQTYEECSYEGYGPGGAALYLECLTDNAKRTVAEIRHLLDRAGGNLGREGSVAWMFERVGSLRLDASRYDEEATLEAALEAGAEDLSREEGEYVILTSPGDFHAVQEALRERGFEILEAELAMRPNSTVRVEGGDAKRLLRLVAALEDHDDVQKLYSNFDVDDEALAEVGST